MKCENCEAKLPSLKTRLTRVNTALCAISQGYHRLLPIAAIDEALTSNGFEPTSMWQFAPGQQARVHEHVGEDKWISVSVYRMPSGNWEVTAYVN